MRDRFSHHAPVNTQLLCHTSDRPYSKLILAPDLFEQLHLASPVQPLPSDRALPPASEYPVGSVSAVGQHKMPNRATSVCRNQLALVCYSSSSSHLSRSWLYDVAINKFM